MNEKIQDLQKTYSNTLTSEDAMAEYIKEASKLPKYGYSFKTNLSISTYVFSIEGFEIETRERRRELLRIGAFGIRTYPILGQQPLLVFKNVLQ